MLLGTSYRLAATQNASYHGTHYGIWLTGLHPVKQRRLLVKSCSCRMNGHHHCLVCPKTAKQCFSSFDFNLTGILLTATVIIVGGDILTQNIYS